MCVLVLTADFLESLEIEGMSPKRTPVGISLDRWPRCNLASPAALTPGDPRDLGQSSLSLLCTFSLFPFCLLSVICKGSSSKNISLIKISPTLSFKSGTTSYKCLNEHPFSWKAPQGKTRLSAVGEILAAKLTSPVCSSDASSPQKRDSKPDPVRASCEGSRNLSRVFSLMHSFEMTHDPVLPKRDSLSYGNI